MKKLLTLCSIFLLGSSLYPQDKTKEQLPIIDMHMHTGLPHEMPVGTLSLCRPAPCMGDSKSVDASKLKEQTLRAMERHNIVKAFLSGVDLSAVLQ